MNLIIGVVIAIVVVLLINYLHKVLLPFVVACFVAYVLQPLVRLNQRLTRSQGRVIPSLLALFEVIVVVALIVYLFLPSVMTDINMLGDIATDITKGRRPMPEWCKPVIDLVDRYINASQIRDLLAGGRLDALLSKGSSLLEESLEVIVSVLSWLLTIIYVIFIMIDYPQITRGFKLIFPHKYREGGMAVVRDVEDSMNHYFRGQGMVAMCAMVFYCIGFSIVKLPLAIPMGLLVGILYMIPYFQYITVVPVALICFIYSLGGGPEFWSELGKCGLVYVVSQCVCDYLITPHIMGKEMGLNPAVILLSLSVWGSLLGIIGMIIALPATALLMSYYERYISEPQNPDVLDNKTEVAPPCEDDDAT